MLNECSCGRNPCPVQEWRDYDLTDSFRQSVEVAEAFKEFSTGAKKDLSGKPRTDLLPVNAMLGIAQVLTFGAQKYSDRNWEKGIPLMSLYGAALRHMFKWANGQDLDEESMLNHLKHAACDISMMIDFIEKQRSDLDDRPKTLSSEVKK